MGNSFIDFVIGHIGEIGQQTLEHLWLTLTSLLFATLIGVGLGIVLVRNKKHANYAMGLINAIQTVPSLALLGFMIPLLGIGATPAIVALFLYALLPIVRNTLTGIEEVDPHIKEAAYGMGLSDRQILTKVELPLATPIIFAGIRTAFVINVGVATLAALIAAGGLGEFIFRGIALNNPNMILAGAIPATLMALVFDIILKFIQLHINRLIKPVLVFFVISTLFLFGYYLINIDRERAFVGGFPSEFIEREDGFVGLKNLYDLELNTVELEIGLMYQAVRNGDVDVISGFSTDGRIEAYKLRSLEDDKGYFPPYHAAPLVRNQTLSRYPYLRDILNTLANQITDSEMARMNYRVDHDKLSPADAAREFLKKEEYDINGKAGNGPTILIGSKNFTESFILAEMFKILIETNSNHTVELRLGFGGTKLIFDALLAGEIDLYPEYTGTGFLVILQPEDSLRAEIQYQRDTIYNYVKNAFDQHYELTWLKPLGFNNTFALMMREDQAAQLQIESISDLSRYLKQVQP